MNPAELVGGVLFHAADPERAGADLLRFLLSDDPSDNQISAANLEPELVRVIRQRLPRDEGFLKSACESGAAWVLGTRFSFREDSWEPVVTLPGGWDYPASLRRGTAETLIGLITGARSKVQIVAPFVDQTGFEVLAGALAASTSRRVEVVVILTAWTTWEKETVASLRRQIERTGDWSRVRVLRTREPSPWPHLKVVLADDSAAYVGSANLTGAGLAGRNLELGVVIRGPRVRAVGEVLRIIDVVSAMA